MGQSKLLIFSSKSLEKPVVTRIFSHVVTNSSFCTSDGSNFHLAVVYVPDSFEHILLLPKRKIPPEIFIYFGFIGSHAQSQDAAAHKNQDTVIVAA